MKTAHRSCIGLAVVLASAFAFADDMPTADQLVAEFHKVYPCSSPENALALAHGNPGLVHSLWESQRPDRERYAAFRLLVAMEDKDVVLKALKDPSTRIRRSAVLDLKHFLPNNKLVPIYIGLLRDPFSGVRYNAAESLAEVPSREALLPLIRLLDDESIEVRSQVLHTLLSWKYPEVTPKLQDLSRSNDVTISGCASLGLARLDNEALDVSRLHQYLAQELPKQTGPPYYGVGAVVNIINAIAENGDSSSLPVLRMATRHNHRYIRNTATEAINAISVRNGA